MSICYLLVVVDFVFVFVLLPSHSYFTKCYIDNVKTKRQLVTGKKSNVILCPHLVPTTKQEQVVIRWPPKLVCCWAGQPKLSSHVTNSFLFYTKLQRLVEFNLCFQLGFKECGICMITLSVCLSASFLLLCDFWICRQVSNKSEKAYNVTNTIKFLHILWALEVGQRERN